MLYPNSTALSATHRYVKFTPVDHSDIVKILEWSFENDILMFDFPLHYEYVQTGDYYIDPEVTDSSLLYQYATVSVDIALPNTSYEVLEDLYFNDTNPFILINSFLLTGNEDKLNQVVGRGIPKEVVDEFWPEGDFLFCDISELPPAPDCPVGCTPIIVWEVISPLEFDCFWECNCPPPPPEPTLNDCGCTTPTNTKFPAGCVQVETDNGTEVPVTIAKIAVWDYTFLFFKKNNITFTDRAGCWEIRREYDEMNMKVIFENSNLKVRDLNYWGGLRVVRDQTNSFDNPPLNSVEIRYDENIDRREWAASHTLNTDLEYRDNVAADNIQLPRTRLNYSLHTIDAPGSAPMLQGINWPFSFNFLNLVG